ncbi:MAG TPA: BTAD domain-containing putative transcriptional regulator, partial [Thermoanaerobaculia bacterium]|nr:BTAD domain-containing putative transcriptional regulator [Thermoanaerobaculia bacterium]
RDRLAGMLWPEESEESARQNLRQAVYNLRSTLGDGSPPSTEWLLSGQQEIRLNPGASLWLDTAVFEQAVWTGMGGRGENALRSLTEAQGLYRGELLAGFYVKDSDLFEEWLASERERFRELAAGAARALIALFEERGDHEAGIRTARHLQQVEPLSEEAHRHLMRFYARSGRRPRALAQYEELKRLLQQELGVDPSVESAAVYAEIRDQEPATSGAPEQPFEPPGPFIPMVGREEALRRLGQVWSEVRRGHPRLTLVEGERGIGKTRLIRTFLHQATAAEPAVILQGRCLAPTAHGSLEPIAEALTSFGPEAVEGRAPERSLSGPLRGAATAIPAIYALRPELLRGGGPADQRERRRRAAAAVAIFLDEISRPQGPRRRAVPVVLFLDDLESAGAATIELLSDVLARLRSGPIWLIGAFRSEETPEDHPLRRALAEIADSAALTRVPLARLDETALERIAGAFVEAEDLPRLRAFLAASGDGLPLAVAETVNLLADEGVLVPQPSGGWALTRDLADLLPSGGVDDLIRRRLALLPTASRRLLTLASVIGDRFDTHLVQAAEREHTSVIEAGLEILIQRWLVRPVLRSWVAVRRERDIALWSGGVRRGLFEFAERTIRTLLYDALEAGRRRDLHLRVAETLAARHLGGSPEIAELLAHHYAEAGDWERAVPQLKIAGDRAAEAQDQNAAFGHYDRALRGLEELLSGRGELPPWAEKARREIADARQALAEALREAP